jgi:hypothetical protein
VWLITSSFKLTTNASQEIQSIGDSMMLYYPVENQNKFKELACVLHHAPNEMVMTCKLHRIIDDNSE